ncbi:MAG TPA: molecular chaperone TorD family protein [Thermoanaerobaculia bacterium]|nr:molecular chaperone TorD family protein [Thermoanaerobaculia bacterium]
MTPSLSLLSRLWLSEPDAETLGAACEAGLASGGDSSGLAAVWTDLFLLNVYPYGSAFTEPSGELNGPSASAALARYEAAGYGPAELAACGGPDHAGLCLGYLAHLDAAGREDPEFLSWTLDWVPVCAIAVERQPSPHPFFRSLAAATREALLARRDEAARSPLPVPVRADEDEEELDLSAVVRRLLAPATSGFFLSRSRLGAIAMDAGMRLPFSSRYDVARALFEAAGESGRVERVLDGLRREAALWDADYSRLAAAHPAWTGRAAAWRQRLAGTLRLLSEMARVLDSPLDLEYGNRERIGPGGP